MAGGNGVGHAGRALGNGVVERQRHVEGMTSRPNGWNQRGTRSEGLSPTPTPAAREGESGGGGGGVEKSRLFFCFAFLSSPLNSEQYTKSGGRGGVPYGGGGGLLGTPAPIAYGLCQQRFLGCASASKGHLRNTPPCVTFRLVVAPLRGPGRSPVLLFACCVGSLLSVGRCGRCSCWCRLRVRGAQ